MTTMNTRIVLLAAPLALLVACSGDDTTVYKLSTGTYAVSGATIGTASPGDQCALIASYTTAGKKIGIDVNAAGTTATFDLVPTSLAIELSSATINGNSLESPVLANYTANYGNCVVRVRRTVVGELTGNDAAALQLHAQIAVETFGSDCTGSPYEAGCQSDIHFLATKLQAP
jgi:hypothetical protein